MSLKQNDEWNENLADLEQPVSGLSKRLMKWILYGNDTRTAKDKFEEYRAGIFPDKEHGLKLSEFNKI